MAKKIKTFLKEMIKVANEPIYLLKDFDNLSDEEYYELSTAIAGLQNSLGGELKSLLKKYNLEWKG